MSIATMILGESGTGKSASLKDFKAEDVLLIQAVKKPLPFRSKEWKPISKDVPGSVWVTDKSHEICSIMRKTKKNIIVVDDFQYIMSNEFMRRVTDQESGNSAFQKYNEIAKDAWEVLNTATTLDEGKRVYILGHTAKDELGNVKIKTIGKLLDEKIVLEGLVTIVLRTEVQNGEYYFRTKNNGADTVKSPIGMFEDDLIPNSLVDVDKTIVEYYGI